MQLKDALKHIEVSIRMCRTSLYEPLMSKGHFVISLQCFFPNGTKATDVPGHIHLSSSSCITASFFLSCTRPPSQACLPPFLQNRFDVIRGGVKRAAPLLQHGMSIRLEARGQKKRWNLQQTTIEIRPEDTKIQQLGEQKACLNLFKIFRCLIVFF